MKFVKNNMVFLILSGVFGLLFLTLLIFSFFLSGSKDEDQNKINEVREEITNLHNQMLPYVGLDHDLKLAAADLDELASIERCGLTRLRLSEAMLTWRNR